MKVWLELKLFSKLTKQIDVSEKNQQNEIN